MVPGARKLAGEEYNLTMEPDDVNPIVVRRWRAYIDGKHDAVFGPWHAFEALSPAAFPKEARGLARRIARNAGRRVNPRVAALFAGGVKEELQRAFVLVRFRDYLGGAKLGLVIWSVAFGAGHYLQGVQNAVAAGLFGLLFGAVYLARGSLVAPMVAHGAYDSLALLAYWFLRRVSG